MNWEHLSKTDPEITQAFKQELDRQEYHLELIASENMVSRAVLEAQGSILTNKYAEGYPGKRYYGGCEHVDIAEKLAIDRAKTLFEAEAANVQPHSGAQANMAVYFTELKPGDTILGMNLSHGGHLTHGSPVNFSGKLYNVHFYGVNKDTEQIDYDELDKLAAEHKPKMIVAGASAYPRAIAFDTFREIADRHGALLVTDMAHIAGLVAAKVHQSPVPYSHYVTTTTHKTLRGPRGGLILTTQDKLKKLNSSVFPGMQGGPLMHVISAKAVALKEASQESFVEYQKQVVTNARTLADALKSHGFRPVSGGTDNHLMLIDLTNKDITGKAAEKALDKAGINANRNTIPFETKSPFVTSGIRIGTPSITTRGMKEDEMKKIAGFINTVVANAEDDTVIERISQEVKELCKSFPVYI